MDLLALVVSALSLLVALGGTYLSNKRAKEALTASKDAAVDGLWSAAQEPVQRLIGFDPSAAPIGERLENLRIATIELVDGLPAWRGLDVWLEAERTLGATYGRQAMTVSRPDDSVEQRVNGLAPLMTWAHALSSNLRFLRSNGYDADALTKLAAHAVELTKELHERNGWALPPERNTRIEPLE